MIAVVNYGMGNIGSIENMLKKLGIPCTISDDPQVLRGATKLILPGVGAFDRGVSNLRERGLDRALQQAVVEEGTPILGICLGMQLLTRGSEEGSLPGFGWIAADTVRFDFPETPDNRTRTVPHMGWRSVTLAPDNQLFAAWEGEARFYFVHSYHVVCDDTANVSSRGHYGFDFTASIEREHIWGVQFHPEKSHKHGMRLLRQFAEA